MALVGPYDASTFVEGDYDTYPPLPPGVDLYQPAMHWNITGAGTIQGQAVVVGDLIFATQGSGRLYGQNTYGDQIYGGLSDGDWTVQQVFFLRWDSTKPPPDTDPYPNAGCAFTRPDLAGGDWAPGWRIVIDAWFNDLVGSRTYGQDAYGDEVYGDADSSGQPAWVDITQPGYRIETGDGTREGIQRVPVSEVVISFYDEDGVWFDFADPWWWYQPQPGTPIRVGLIDPEFRYHPVIVGEIERVEDVHDGDHPRVVMVRAFGQLMDLVVDVIGLQSPAERTSTRYNRLVGLVGWQWGSGDMTFPDDADADLHADNAPRDIVVRDELDRTVQSAGWFLDQDRRGYMRVRRWPHEPDGPVLQVADCDEHDDPADVVVAPSMTLANDESQLLNWVIATNAAEPMLEVRGESSESISRFGKRGRALDYPKTGLAFADPTQAATWVWRIVDRFSFITRHVEELTADTDVDQGWLPVLAELDTGQAVQVLRRHPHPLVLDAVVTGWRHVLEPGRWVSSLFVSTSTRSQ